MSEERQAGGLEETILEMRREIDALKARPSMGKGVGQVDMWFVDPLPDGALLLDGSTLNRESYPILFQWAEKYDKVGSGKMFGAGNGTTTFVLPNYTDKFPKGWTAPELVGSTGGSNSRQLTVNQMPQHNHTMQNAGVHSHTGSTNSTGAHAGHNQGVSPPISAGSTYTVAVNTQVQLGNHSHTLDINDSGNHTHTINNAGSGQAFDNRPEFFVVYWIMWTGQ